MGRLLKSNASSSSVVAAGGQKMASGRRELSIEAKFAAKRRAWATQPRILQTIHHIYLGDGRRMEELGH